MLHIQPIPKQISPLESLARYLYTPSMVIGDRIINTAFELSDLPSGPETSLSVTRLDYCKSISLGDLPKARISGDKPVGYAQNLWEDWIDCQNDSVSVNIKSAPSKSNPAHAGIKYYFKGERITGRHGCFLEPDFQEFLTDISVRSSFIPL